MFNPAERQMLINEIVEGVVNRLANQPRFVDRSDLCKLLGLSESSIDRLTKDGQIPAIRCGRRIKYVLADVIAALSCGSSPTGDQEGDDATSSN